MVIESLVMPAEEWDAVWNKDMEETHTSSGALEKWAEFYLKGFRGKKVLEVGCGSGIYSATIAGKGAEVHAVDFSKSATILSQYTAAKVQSHVCVYQADSLTLPFKDSSFDLVFSEGLLEHISPDNQEEALAEQIRVVKPRGFIIVDMPELYEIRKSGVEALDRLEEARKIKLIRTYSWGVCNGLSVFWSEGYVFERLH